MKKFNENSIKHLKTANTILNVFYHTKKNRTPIEISDAKEIIIIDPTLIGDIVMLTPLLRTLKKNAPQSRITMVCASWAKTILEYQGLVNDFYIIDPHLLNSPKQSVLDCTRLYKLLKQINAINYNVALEPRGDLRYIYFMHFIHASRKISYNYTGGECLLTDVVVPSNKVKHLVEDKMYFAKMIGCKFNKSEMYPQLVLSEDQKKENEDFINSRGIKGRKIIGIHPGASLEHKRWKKYDHLIAALGIENAAYLVFSGPGEENLALSVIKNAKARSGSEMMIIHVHESVRDYIRILATCDICICNDSGAGHLTAAYGIPTVVLMGPFDASFAKPYAENSIAIEHPMGCKPCISNICLTGTSACIDSIEVDEVKDKVYQAMEV